MRCTQRALHAGAAQRCAPAEFLKCCHVRRLHTAQLEQASRASPRCNEDMRELYMDADARGAIASPAATARRAAASVAQQEEAEEGEEAGEEAATAPPSTTRSLICLKPH